MPATKKLPKRQAELLERVCLKRYTVYLHHYMGSMNPNENVTVSHEVPLTDEQRATGMYGRMAEDSGMRIIEDRSFRASTVEALRSKGLVRYARTSAGRSEIKPTRAGLDAYRAAR